MITNSSLRMAHEYIVSKEAYEKTTQIMLGKVSIPTSDRYNAKYDGKDLHLSLISLSINNSFAESGMERLAVESSGRVPSASTPTRRTRTSSSVRIRHHRG